MAMSHEGECSGPFLAVAPRERGECTRTPHRGGGWGARTRGQGTAKEGSTCSGSRFGARRPVGPDRRRSDQRP